MSNNNRRAEDQVLDPAYTQDLGSLPVEEVRRRRGECERIETEISYVRRLLQAKIDILRHELERISNGSSRGASIKEIRESLPSILSDSDEGASRSQGSETRHTQYLNPPNAASRQREVEVLASEATLSHIDGMSAGEISEIARRLVEAEAQSSQQRRRVQKVVDELKAELVRRYAEGSEDPAALLNS